MGLCIEARADNLNNLQSDPNFRQVLGSCGKQVDSAGKKKISELYAFAITSGRLSYLAAKKAESSNESTYCIEVQSDDNCSKAQKTIDCIEGTHSDLNNLGSAAIDTAKQAVEAIKLLEAVVPFINAAGVLSRVANEDGTILTSTQISQFTALKTQLGTGPNTQSVTVTNLDMVELLEQIQTEGLKEALNKEASDGDVTDGVYVACLRRKIAAHTANSAVGCGSASTEGTPATTTTTTGGGGSSETVTQDESAPDELFNSATSTATATKTSQAAWKNVQTLENSGAATSNVRNLRSQAVEYSSLSRRIRTNFRGATGSKMPLPLTRGMGVTASSTASVSKEPGSRNNTPNGILTTDQTQSAESGESGTCSSSAKLAADAEFYADKPAFRGIKTLHLFEILHAGSEATATDWNGDEAGGAHAILTSPFRAIVPSQKMEDEKNKEMKAAGLSTVYRPFVRLRGFCPTGATEVTLGGASAPRIVTSIAGLSTNSFQTSNKITCVADSFFPTYKVFDVIVIFSGRPGLHQLELKADNIGADGGSLSCKQDIFVAGSSNKTTYAEYLKNSDMTNNATLAAKPRIAATLLLSASTGEVVATP